MIKTKDDLFYFLVEQKINFLYKAQEAEDLHNIDSAIELRTLAEQMDKITKRLSSELNT